MAGAGLGADDDGPVLQDVVDFLRCPVCSGDVALTGRTLRCPAGHSFDIARQGYVNLLPGGARPGGDTAAMVRARRDFLGAGHLRPLANLIAQLVADLVADPTARFAGRRAGQDRGFLVDAGTGTGYYLAAVLDRLTGYVGAALDLSTHAAAAAARAHPRAGAVVCDVWRALPVRDGSASAILNVCAPRNGEEFRRILRAGGTLVVATPTPAHLGELVGPLGLVSVDARKEERLAGALEPHFEAAGSTPYDARARLTRGEVAALTQMGPSAHHVAPDALRDRVASVPEPAEVTLSFEVRTYRPRAGTVTG